MTELDLLNSNQQYAVNWNDGALLVIGGASSGKSSLIASRAVRLLKDSTGRYGGILALTTTKHRSNHIREHVAKNFVTVQYGLDSISYDTFAYRLLSQHGSHIGLKPNYSVITDNFDRLVLLNEAIRRINGSYSNLTGAFLLPIIDRFMETVCDKENGKKITGLLNLDFSLFESIYLEYRNVLIEKNLLDQPSLIVEVIGLINNVKGVRKQMYRWYRYICVDDFQKSSLPQFKLLCELVNPESENLFVIDEEDGKDYLGNGVKQNFSVQLRQKFNMRLLCLPEDYRCPETVISVANRLIDDNVNDQQGEDTNQRNNVVKLPSKHISLYRFSNSDEEMEWIARSISSKTMSEREKCVIIASTKIGLSEAVAALKRHSLCGTTDLSKTNFSSIPMQWLLSVLRLAANRSNADELWRVCKTFFDLTGIDTDPNNIIAVASSSYEDYLRGWAGAVLRCKISAADKEMIEGAVVRMLADRLNHEDFQVRAFEWFDERSRSCFKNKHRFKEYTDERKTWHSLLQEVYSRVGAERVPLHTMLHELDLLSGVRERPVGAIPCMTVHAPNGKGYHHVYMVGMVEEHLPSLVSISKGNCSREMEEERRDCFMAITRASESLHLTFSDRVGNKRTAPSRFLSEIGILGNEVRPLDVRTFSPNSVVSGGVDLDAYRIAS